MIRVKDNHPEMKIVFPPKDPANHSPYPLPSLPCLDYCPTSKQQFQHQSILHLRLHGCLPTGCLPTGCSSSSNSSSNSNRLLLTLRLTGRLLSKRLPGETLNNILPCRLLGPNILM